MLTEETRHDCVKHPSFNRRLLQFSTIAELFAAGQACANDIGSAGTVRVRLIDRKNSNEPGIVPTPDSNLLAHGATRCWRGQTGQPSSVPHRSAANLLGQALPPISSARGYG
jgi:hypothetical protein